jgi:D-alanine transaminase
MSAIVYLDGQWLPTDKAKVSVFDRGFLFGDGVYEVIMVYNRQPFRLEQHLTRLFRSLEQTGIPNPLGLHEWRYIVERLIEQTASNQQSIYLQVTRGVAEKRSHTYPQGLIPTIFASSQSIAVKKSDTRLNSPCTAVLLEDIRWARGDIKSTSLLGSVLLKKQVSESGKDEGILHRQGKITEGTASNVFVVKDDVILTPPDSDYLLTGITRDFIFELADRYGLACLPTELTVEQLYTSDEIWMTSSTAEMRAVIELDGLPVGNGQIGALWKTMAALYQKHKSELFSSCA